jgi:hypothetical protein
MSSAQFCGGICTSSNSSLLFAESTNGSIGTLADPSWSSSSSKFEADLVWLPQVVLPPSRSFRGS